MKKFKDALGVKKELDELDIKGKLLNNFFIKINGKYKNLNLYIVFDKNKLYQDNKEVEKYEQFLKKIESCCHLIVHTDLHYIMESINMKNSDLKESNLKCFVKESNLKCFDGGWR